MTTTTVVFIVLAILALVAGYRVVTSDKIMHAALWLGLCFLVVAGIFLLLEAEFLAAAQVLIYVGAVTTIMIFGIMLSDLSELRSEDARRSLWERAGGLGGLLRRGFLPFVAVAGFAGTMIWVYTKVLWPAAPPAVPADGVWALGRGLFTDFIIPFELAAVVLLVALVGAIVIAAREEK